MEDALFAGKSNVYQRIVPNESPDEFVQLSQWKLLHTDLVSNPWIGRADYEWRSASLQRGTAWGPSHCNTVNTVAFAGGQPGKPLLRVPAVTEGNGTAAASVHHIEEQ